MVVENFLYSDINQTNPINKTLIYDVEAVTQSIINILATPKKTRLFLPGFGSNLSDSLFEIMNKATELVLYNTVISAIETWDPRVIFDYSKSYIIPDYDNHIYHIQIVFSIAGIENNVFSLVVPLILEGG